MQRFLIVVSALLLSSSSSVSAFTVVSPVRSTAARSPTARSPTTLLLAEKNMDTDVDLAEPGRNPDRPELPELKGDFDWDEKFGNDDDWVTGDAVPGKGVLDDISLAKQATALDGLEEKWRKQRMNTEYQGARLLGWTEQAETYNGRFAMFFLVVGLLTELWTGISMPGQVEEMLRVGGVIGFDG